MKNGIFIICALLLTVFLVNAQQMRRSDQRVYVPDEETAIKIAEVIWLPIYGRKIYKYKPFKAILTENDTWIIQGTLKKNTLGGGPYAEIQRSDCKVLKVTHGK